MEGEKRLWGSNAKIGNFKLLLFRDLPVKTRGSFLAPLWVLRQLLFAVNRGDYSTQFLKIQFIPMFNNDLTAVYLLHFYKTHDCP